MGIPFETTWGRLQNPRGPLQNVFVNSGRVLQESRENLLQALGQSKRILFRKEGGQILGNLFRNRLEFLQAAMWNLLEITIQTQAGLPIKRESLAKQATSPGMALAEGLMSSQQ